MTQTIKEQILAIRSFSRTEQPMHAPNPQPMRVSREHCPSAREAPHSAFIMGTGPQA